MRATSCVLIAAIALTGVLACSQQASPSLANADGRQSVTSPVQPANEVTESQNLSRDGWDSGEPALSPAAVAAKSFGQIFDTRVNGQVFAQPLSVGNSVLVATENDYVYSINRNTGAVNWSRQLGSPYAAAAEDCAQTPVVLPYIGVTSAPGLRPEHRNAVRERDALRPARRRQSPVNPTPTYDLFALNETTGAIKWQQADRRLAGQQLPPHVQRRRADAADWPAAAPRLGVHGLWRAVRGRGPATTSTSATSPG